MVRRRRSFVLLCTTVLWLPAALPPPPAWAVQVRILQNAQSQLLSRQKKMRRLQAGMESQKTLVAKTARQEKSLLTELARLDSQLTAERQKLADLQAKNEALKAKLQDKEAAVQQLHIRRRKREKQIKKRLAAHYRTRKTDLINVLFSTTSLPMALQLDTYYQYMVTYDAELIAAFRASQTALEQAIADLTRQRQTLNLVIGQVRDQERQLAATHKKRSHLLRRVKTEKQLYQRALEEIGAAARSLTATIQALKKESLARQQVMHRHAKGPAPAPPSQPKTVVPTGAIAARKGQLPSPVAGTVTRTFGTYTDKQFGIAMTSAGITIKTRPGAAIKAVFRGRVVYNGQMRGYGNLLIIDHGDQYYSLYARAQNFYPPKGTVVNSGEIVGIAGLESGLLADGIHFEIRHGTTPEDPLLWLAPNQLTVAKN